MYSRRSKIFARFLLKRTLPICKTSNSRPLTSVWNDDSSFLTNQNRENRNRKTRRRCYSSSDKNRGSGMQKHGKQPRVVNLKDARKSVNRLLVSLDKISLYTETERQLKEEQSLIILEEAKEALHSIIASVDQGFLNPSGKHGKELSKFMELILYAYCEICQIQPTDTSLFDECQKVLTTIQQWNLDIRSKHYEYTILVANHEGRYRDAADLFMREIDPDVGYNPINVSIKRPFGLYAIARWAQEEGLDVAECVFDAVMQLSMVSPSDQATYVLAAGTALGNVGEWQSAKTFLENSHDVNEMGQPLITAVMHACLLSNRPDAALEAFDYGINKQGIVGGGEWQWGGGRDKFDPLCRDIAMRAMRAKDGMSSLALDFFQQSLEENVHISLEALQGVLEACEQDKNWKGAISVLFEIIRTHDKPNWIVSGSEMSIQEYFQSNLPKSNGESKWISQKGPLLASVMRSCNSTLNFGAALFCIQMVDLASETTKVVPVVEDSSSQQSVEAATMSILEKTEHCNDVLVAAMVSLCGLRCYENASTIFKSARNATSDALRVYEFAQSERDKHGTIHVGNPWVSAAKDMHRLFLAVELLKEGRAEATPSGMEAIYIALASAMKSSTYVRQSKLSLVLFSWTIEKLEGIKSEFLLVNTKVSSNNLDTFAMKKDFLLAEFMNAHRWSNNVAKSIELFESLLGSSSEDMKKWRHSCNAGLSALVANGQGAGAFEIFGALDQSALTQESYATIGNFLAKEKKWEDVLKLYSTALKQGISSDELSLLAMEAVVSSEVENRILVLRAIIDDTVKNNGFDAESWLRSRYWNVKKRIGFKYSRLLMWWNDPHTCDFDELEFAIGDFRERKAAGLKVKYETIRTILYNSKKGTMQEGSIDYRFVPTSVQEWVKLLQEVTKEMHNFSTPLDSRLIDDIVKSYLALDCRQECVEFVSEELNKGARINKKSLVEVLDAAHMEYHENLADDIEMMLSR